MPTVYQIADKIFKEPETDYLNYVGMAVISVWRNFYKEDPPKIDEKIGNEMFQVFNYSDEFEEVIKFLLMGKKGKVYLKEAIKNYEKYLETGVLEKIEQPKKKFKKKYPKKHVSVGSQPKKKRKRIRIKKVEKVG